MVSVQVLWGVDGTCAGVGVGEGQSGVAVETKATQVTVGASGVVFTAHARQHFQEVDETAAV